MKNKIILTVLILSMIALIFSGCGGIITPETPSDSLSAVITASPTSGEVPLKVTFDASESSAAQSNEIMSYEWDFGDDKTGEGQTVQHDFGSPGNYTVTLIIINNKGAVDTSSVIITVFQPTETVIEQNFNTQNGTEFDTGTGLKVSVPPSLNAEEVKLIVKYYSDPPQINDCIGNLFSAYSFNMIYEKESQRQKLRPLRGSFEPIKLTFDIPEEEDVRGALIVNKTDEGWVIAENKEGPYGGTIFEDGKKISISLEYSSDYALSTPAVLTYNQQDMQELLSELEAQNAVIESAPSVIPNYKGIIIIPKEDFPEGKGTAIPIHIPFYKYSSNANMEEESWNKKWEKTIRVIKKNYWALLATFDPGGLPLTPVGAAASFLVALEEASGNINEIYDITITIQENKNTGGNLRAIIQLGDPESAQWQRRIAGKAEMKGGPFVDGAWTDIWYRMIQDFCKEIGLPCKYSYYLLLESDLRHKEDEYVGYLSINEDNSFVEIPKIYSEDCIKIGHFELLFKRVIDIEFPILNSYILGKDFETAILEELSPIQIGLESAQSNLVPIANAGPDQTVQIGTLVTIDGSASYDNDGDTLSYNWTQIKGPEIVNLSDSNISKPTFTLTEVGVYEFELIVNDGKDDSEPDNVIINVMGSSCTAPGLFTLNAIPECNGTTSQIRLNWTNSSGASSYDVYRNNTLYYSDLAGTQFINSGNITVGTTYSYYIVAKNSCDSTTSNIVSATAINCDSVIIPSLKFTGLTPSQISTSTAPYQAILSATGSNFNNVNRVSFSWSGAASGSATWYKGDTNWNNKVTINSDSSMTLQPRVVETNPTWSGTAYWTVTMRDTTGATASKSFTVSYTPPSTISATINSYSPSSKITVNTGQSFTISTSFTNTGNTAAYFYPGVSIWNSNGSLIFTDWGSKKYLSKNQQGSASWSPTINTPGEYWLQFGIWNEAKSELLDKEPSPSQNLIKVTTPSVSLSFTGLTPSQISTSIAPYQATLSATGSNFNNLNRVSFSWSGAASGSATWYKGDANWNNKVTINSDNSMTLQPGVVETNPTWSGTAYWTVTLRDNTSATASKSFTVTYTQLTPQVTGVDPSQPTASPSRQYIDILGNNFASNAQVILQISSSVYPIPDDRTYFINSARIEVYVGLTDSGNWKVWITNPDGQKSNEYSFYVKP